MPGTARGVQSYAERHGVTRRPKAKGKGWEYQVSKLPEETRKAWHLKVAGAEKNLPAKRKPRKVAAQTVASLKKWQRDVMDARLVILREVDFRAESESVREAMKSVVFLAESGLLPEEVQQAILVALGKVQKGKAVLSVRTIQRWRAMLKKGGMAALAPKPMDGGKVPKWASAFMRFYRDRRQPSIKAALEMLIESGYKNPPSYNQVRRYLDQIGAVEASKGRLSRTKILSMLPFIRRDTSGLSPMDVVNGDGHTACLLVRHPNNGKPFRPELTEVFCVATRRHVGWSINYSENKYAVMDALRMAVASGGLEGQPGGVPAVVHWDNGSGVVNKALQDEVTGLQHRLGFEFYHQLPGRPQAGGVVEKGHHAVLIPAAEAFDTYIGKKRNDDRLLKEVNDKLKAGKIHLPSMEELTVKIEEQRAKYNDRPHPHLPKVIDPITRQRRHQSPNEAWQGHLEAGWKPVVVEDALHEFRLEETRTVRRGELRDYHGKKVRVRFDPADGAKVWVYTLGKDDQFICEAERDANKLPYLFDNIVEKGQQKRMQAQVKRKERQIEEIRQQNNAPLEIEAQEITPQQRALAETVAEGMTLFEDTEPATVLEETPIKGERPRFSGPMAERDWGKWALEHQEQLSETERASLEVKLEDPRFRMLLGIDEEMKTAS